MHELAITQSVVDLVADRTAGRRVGVVRIRVGALAGVLPDAMQFCYELVTSGTPLEGSTLAIEQIPGSGHCRSCDLDIELPDLIPLCSCGSADVQVLTGRELQVASVELVASCA